MSSRDLETAIDEFAAKAGAVADELLEARADLSALRAVVTQIEQEMRQQNEKMGNAGHRMLSTWADRLALALPQREKEKD